MFEGHLRNSCIKLSNPCTKRATLTFLAATTPKTRTVVRHRLRNRHVHQPHARQEAPAGATTATANAFPWRAMYGHTDRKDKGLLSLPRLPSKADALISKAEEVQGGRGRAGGCPDLLSPPNMETAVRAHGITLDLRAATTTALSGLCPAAIPALRCLCLATCFVGVPGLLPVPALPGRMSCIYCLRRWYG